MTDPRPPIFTATAPPERPIQRVGHIGDTDNRFCGAAVFGQLAGRIGDPIDLCMIAFGVPPLAPDDHEVLRVIALCLTSPDARVWPLKLTRVLASFGNAYAGHYGAQLVNFSASMGPGACGAAAGSLAWIADRVRAGATVADAVAAHLDERGKLGGFGVPMRAEDERLLGMYQLLADHPARRRPTWRLFVEVADVMRARQAIEPNVACAIAALLVDVGLAPSRTGLFVSAMMVHTFAAHAVEAAEHDAAHLQRLPDDVLDYVGRAPRSLATDRDAW